MTKFQHDGEGAPEKGSALRLVKERLLAKGAVPKEGSETEWHCPLTDNHAHGDQSASLTVRYGDDNPNIVLVACAQCRTKDNGPEFLKALGLTMKDLYDRPAKVKRGKVAKIDRYVYTDETGERLFRVVKKRYEHGKPDVFQQRWDDEEEKFRGGEGVMRGCRKPLYRLDRLLEAVGEGWEIHLTEGESDADALNAWFIRNKVDAFATCHPEGAGKWQPEHTATLAGAARLVVWADRDAPGYACAHKRLSAVLAAELKASARLPVEGNDVRDHLAAGHAPHNGEPIEEEKLANLAGDTKGQDGRSQGPSIRVGNRQLRDMTEDAIAALSVANEPPVVFQRAGQLVEATAEGVSELGAARLQYRLANVADWFKLSKTGDRVPQFPDKTTVQNVAVAIEQWPFPVLDRVVSTPVFAADGSLRTEPGYHPASRTLYQPPADLTVPPVPIEPGAAEVKRARGLVGKLFSEFPFDSPSDRAHAWAMFLQPFAREMIRGETPLYGVEAPKQGTGKTLLVRSALAAAVGQLSTGSDPRNDDEMRKRITAAVMQAEQAVVIDNVIKRVDYPSLASALTSEVWHDRILGETRNVSAPIFGTWVLTGNNPQYSDDIARRVVPIRLDSHVEHPHLRGGFKKSLPAWALARRGELVWAACVLISAWLVGGRPGPGADVPGLGSYGPWRRVLGGILELHGVPGLLGNLLRASETSPDTEALEALLAIVIDPHKMNKPGGAPFTSVELAQWLQDEPDVQGLIFQQHGGTTAQQLGKFLSDHRNQIVQGHHLVRAGRAGAGMRWRFEPVPEAGS